MARSASAGLLVSEIRGPKSCPFTPPLIPTFSRKERRESSWLPYSEYVRLQSALEVHLSAVNNRLCEVMRVLTVIATLFIPLTFIAGVYGMKFQNPESPWAMPELYWYYSYPVVLLIMLFVAGGMLLYFRRKGWLSR